MHRPIDIPLNDGQRWVYASLTVWDGTRKLKPTHVASDRLLFSHAPRLTSSQVEILLVNGKAQQRHRALVLQHKPDATHIPIQLLPAEG